MFKAKINKQNGKESQFKLTDYQQNVRNRLKKKSCEWEEFYHRRGNTTLALEDIFDPTRPIVSAYHKCAFLMKPGW